MPPEGAQRYAAVLEYNGAGYFGWQRQKDADTPGVQNFVESALSQVADHSVEVVCAGRTDTGVHASYQVIHFDSPAPRQAHQWLLGCNANLPGSIRIRNVQPVSQEFHARFSARKRRYLYCIDNRPVRPGLFSGLYSWCKQPLDTALMQQEANVLLGEHDFTSFRAAGCQAASPMRELLHLSVHRYRDLVLIDVAANAFLQHMVRNIAGVLMAVGSGRQAAGWTAEVLAARDRTRGGVTAVPDGLYLCGVDYPAQFELPDVQPDPLLAALQLAEKPLHQ